MIITRDEIESRRNDPTKVDPRAADMHRRWRDAVERGDCLPKPERQITLSMSLSVSKASAGFAKADRAASKFRRAIENQLHLRSWLDRNDPGRSTERLAAMPTAQRSANGAWTVTLPLGDPLPLGDCGPEAEALR